MKELGRVGIRLLEREGRGLLGPGPRLLAINPGIRGEPPSSSPPHLRRDSLLAQRKQV